MYFCYEKEFCVKYKFTFEAMNVCDTHVLVGGRVPNWMTVVAFSSFGMATKSRWIELLRNNGRFELI
jgi:hypothetical protein